MLTSLDLLFQILEIQFEPLSADLIFLDSVAQSLHLLVLPCFLIDQDRFQALFLLQ